MCLSLPTTLGKTGVACSLGDMICRLEKTTQGRLAASHGGALGPELPQMVGVEPSYFLGSERAAGALLFAPPSPPATKGQLHRAAPSSQAL